MNNKFQLKGLEFYGVNFITEDVNSKEKKKLFAVFHYVHHAMTIDEINKELKGKGLRSATRQEMEDFFNFHDQSVRSLTDIPFFIVTDPGDIKHVTQHGNVKSIPCVWKKEGEDALITGSFKIHDDVIPDHRFFYVMAIDESKSE